jgi:hypothetical protein
MVELNGVNTSHLNNSNTNVRLPVSLFNAAGASFVRCCFMYINLIGCIFC